MRIIHGQLLHLAGAAFEGDPFVSTGLAHLRWMMDHRLGFPRIPFVLERRPSVRTEEGRQGLTARTMLPDQMRPSKRTGKRTGVLRGLEGELTPPQRPGDPWVFDFTGVWGRRGTSVCWVEVRFGSRGTRRLVALRDDRGQAVPVDSLATSVKDRWPSQLSGSQIDRLEIWSADQPTQLRLLSLADLDAASDWANTLQVPIATDLHGQHLQPSQLSVQQMVDQALGGFRGPLLQHPLDQPPGPDPDTIPLATLKDIDRRYRQPWFNHYEPLARGLLKESLLPGSILPRYRLHQSELLEQAQVTQFSTSTRLANAAQAKVSVYASLMAAAASDFHLAKLLGLAAVPEESVQATPGVWDYRLTGEWDVEDLLAYEGALNRRMIALRDELPGGSVTPEATARLARSVAALDVELRLTADLIRRWTNQLQEPLTVAAFALGISVERAAPFAPPAGVTVVAKPPEVPGRTDGVTTLRWDVRLRAGASDQASGAYSAIAWRSRAGSADDWLNEASTIASLGGQRQALLTQDSEPSLVDRALPLNEDVRYSVAECDAWGRWSRYAAVTTRLDHRMPPPPVACEASLLPSITAADAHRLRIRFRWDVNASWDGARVSGALSSMAFALCMRTSAPMGGQETDPAQWDGFPTQPGATTPALVLRGTVGVSTVTLGSAQVQIAAPVDRQDPPPAPPTLFRQFDLVVDPITLPDAGGGTRRVWVAIRTQHDQEGLCPTMGQMAFAEHIPSIPPSNPVFPPDPIQASWSDADGRSSAVLKWTQLATPAPADWAQLLSAGETEIIAAAEQLPSGRLTAQQSTMRTQALATTGSTTATLAARATAVRQLATLTPEVFAIEQTRLPLSAGLMRVTVELPGGLMPLRLYVVRPMTAQGVSADWPTSADGIAAVKVPQAVFPARPIICSADRIGATVELRVVEPPPRTAKVGRYELYRSTNATAAASGDHRRMWLIVSVEVSDTSWKPWVWFDDDVTWVTDQAGVSTPGPPRERRALVLTDPQAPSSVTYYCVVARAAGEAGNQGRSLPSAITAIDGRRTVPSAPTGLVVR